MFVSQHLFDEDEDSNDEHVFPTVSALFILEWLAFEKVSILGMVNIPTEPIRREKNGEVVEQHSANSIGLGFSYTPISFKAFPKASIEPQFGLLGSTTTNSTSSKGNYFFPIAVARLHLVSVNDFTLYVGSAFAFKKDTLALIYGVGYRF